jgi:hypothetical protein
LYETTSEEEDDEMLEEGGDDTLSFMVPDLVYRFQMICFGGTYCIEQKTD